MSLYPPLSIEELAECRSFENVTRVVVTKFYVYGLTSAGRWIRFIPARQTREIDGRPLGAETMVEINARPPK